MANYRWINEIMLEQMPCDGCLHNSRCKANKMACLAFSLYVIGGKDNWSLPRKPTRMLYLRTMTDDISLTREINKKLESMENA